MFSVRRKIAGVLIGALSLTMISSFAAEAKAPVEAKVRVVNETGKTITRVCIQGRYAAKFAPNKGVDWKKRKCWGKLANGKATGAIQARYNYGFGTTGQNFWHVYAYFSDGTGVSPRWSGSNSVSPKRKSDWKQCSLTKKDKGRTLSIRLKKNGAVLYDMPKSSDCKQTLKRYRPASSRPRLYNIAHMTNTIGGLNWSVKQGANAVEADLKFDNLGNATEFHHGSPCDCTAAKYGICKVQKGCNGKTGAAALLRAIAKHSSKIALVIIDSKLDKDMGVGTQLAIGRKIIPLLENELFKKGYRGNVIVGAPYKEHREYIGAASSAAGRSEFKNRLFFTIDGEGKNFSDAMSAISRAPRAQRTYGTGIAAIAPGSYYDQVRNGVRARSAGNLAFVYAWTIDKRSSMTKYLRSGVDGIMTNDPAALRDILKKGGRVGGKGLRLARPGDPLR